MKNEIENQILKNNVLERDISDDKYAPIIIRNIMYSVIGTISVGVLYKILSSINL